MLLGKMGVEQSKSAEAQLHRLASHESSIDDQGQTGSDRLNGPGPYCRLYCVDVRLFNYLRYLIQVGNREIDDDVSHIIVVRDGRNGGLPLQYCGIRRHRFDFVETPRANEEVVPNDVKEGYFAVFSVNPEEEPKRFIVELHWLTNPLFLKLLTQAENEYEFDQKGVLEVPCRAVELHKILELNIGN
ncbi:hypothetical protein CQW23_24089 [Capsicum baccatum]|uniref:Auxin-responsive protein SAUR32 n=1 Tax=Capsicum baccatum TaxID=33114 RepID=A0A2G2VTS1_CAPBA|nr:hypothetical protein CQW23_24089 [Capsicum baccatum]